MNSTLFFYFPAAFYPYQYSMVEIFDVISLGFRVLNLHPEYIDEMRRIIDH